MKQKNKALYCPFTRANYDNGFIESGVVKNSDHKQNDFYLHLKTATAYRILELTGYEVRDITHGLRRLSGYIDSCKLVGITVKQDKRNFAQKRWVRK